MSAPSVPLPPGADWPDERLGWEPGAPQPYRIIYGVPRAVTDHDALVQTCAVQHADGRFDRGDDAPHVKVEIDCYRGLSSTQARELASALLDAVGEVDEWIVSAPGQSDV